MDDIQQLLKQLKLSPSNYEQAGNILKGIVKGSIEKKVEQGESESLIKSLKKGSKELDTYIDKVVKTKRQKEIDDDNEERTVRTD